MNGSPLYRPKALVACLPDPSWNPRSFRAGWLLDRMGYDVWYISPVPRYELPWMRGCLQIKSLSKGFLSKMAQRLLTYIWRVAGVFPITHGFSESLFWYLIGGWPHLDELRKSDFKVVVVEDLPMLNVILDNVGKDTKVLFDAREYFPREFDSSKKFMVLDEPRFVMSLKKGIPRLHGFYTVNDALSAEYDKEFGRKPEVIRSTPFFSDQHPNLNVGKPIRLVYHGVANRERGLDKMIEVMRRVGSGFSLDLFLVGNKTVIDELREMTEMIENVSIHPPVEFSRINEMLSVFDLGFAYVQPTVFNYRYGLPNKLFEFIQARLGVIIGPSPEMAVVIDKYQCGLASSEFTVESMAELLLGLNETDVIRMKMASHFAATELCWEVESDVLRRMIDSPKA